MELERKLQILGDAAKYDASCSSSGSGRQGKGGLGNGHMAGICHTWSADGRCVSLLKVLLSNACRLDCAYCINRCSNSGTPRATFEPEELAALTVEFYRRNYIEGLFLSSGVIRSPDYTMELVIRTLKLLRETHRFHGYIHVKVIPHTDPRLVEQVGLLADRISVNIELPSSGSLKLLAPAKSPEGILDPMDFIRRGKLQNESDRKRYRSAPLFAPAGQTTQMIVGATPDSDRAILRLSKGLYRKYTMKRVYFSAYMPVGKHPALPSPDRPAPLVREHRLYQADWLMRFYGFDADEIVEDGSPNLDRELDPKCAWALRHIDFFPVEVNTADYEALLRVPGVGVLSARRILSARRRRALEAEDLKKIGVVMKRAQYFITAKGRFCGKIATDSPFLRDFLLERRAAPQLSLFDADSPPALPPGLHLSDASMAALNTLPALAAAKTEL